MRLSFRREVGASVEQTVERTIEVAQPFDVWRRSEDEKLERDRLRLDEVARRIAAIRRRIAPEGDPEEVRDAG
jgi:hypothetical protein